MIRVLIIYDITDDKARKKVSDSCQDYGLDRYQFSMFGGQLKSTHLRGLAKELRHLAEGKDRVLILSVDADNWERRIQIGAEYG